MMPFLSVRRIGYFRSKRFGPKSYVDEAGAKIESYSVHIRNDN
jgi:hypothetical protein